MLRTKSKVRRAGSRVEVDDHERNQDPIGLRHAPARRSDAHGIAVDLSFIEINLLDAPLAERPERVSDKSDQVHLSAPLPPLRRNSNGMTEGVDTVAHHRDTMLARRADEHESQRIAASNLFMVIIVIEPSDVNLHKPLWARPGDTSFARHRPLPTTSPREMPIMFVRLRLGGTRARDSRTGLFA
jgi:hypothetical protein